MEEMLKTMKESEKRCQEMARAVEQKLAAIGNLEGGDACNTIRQNGGTNMPSCSSTPVTPSFGGTSQVSHNGLPDWSRPSSPAHEPQKQTTSQPKPNNHVIGDKTAAAQHQTTEFPAGANCGVVDIPETRRMAAAEAQMTASPTTAAVDALRMLAAAAQGKSTTASRKKGIPHDYVFPYELVDRGEAAHVVKKADATREEYVLGLKRLESHPNFPSHALKALSKHQIQVAQDNCQLPWPVVRRYSEEIFSRIADGRLAAGWHDEAQINAVRLEVIAMAKFNSSDASASDNKPQNRSHQDPKNPFDKETMGAPCLVWNRDPDKCEKAKRGESHGSGNQKYAHICGFCAYVRKVVAPHAEQKCYSKRARAKNTDKSVSQIFSG